MSNVSMIDGHIDREERKLTDKEIIKALECCSSPKANCEDCPCFNKDCISTTPYVLDLINRQQAEIERLTINMNAFGLGMKQEKERADTIRAEAIKEFAERLEEKIFNCELVYVYEHIDNLVKEMVGK